MDYREQLEAAKNTLDRLEGIAEDLSGADDCIDLLGAVQAAIDEAKAAVKALTPYADKEWEEEDEMAEREYWASVI